MREWLQISKDIVDSRFPNCQYVFNHDGNPIVEFRKAWKSACIRANVPGLLFHDLRRSAIRNMRLAGISENVAMEISGHRTRSVFDRYNIVSSRDISNAAEKMDQRLKASLGTILGTVDAKAPDSATACKGETNSKLLN